MAWKNDLKLVVCDFLRHRITDPRSRAEAVGTDTFSGTGASQTLTLTPSSGNIVSCITDVQVDSSSINKWEDYDIDLQNKTITGTFASGSNNITVSYKEGTTTWIYPDLAKISLTITSYPRINILIISERGQRMGYEGSSPADIQKVIQFQSDVWVKEDYYYSDGTNTWSGPHLAMYLARQIIKAFEDNIEDVYPALYHFSLINVRDATWEVDREVFHVIVEFELSTTYGD